MASSLRWRIHRRTCKHSSLSKRPWLALPTQRSRPLQHRLLRASQLSAALDLQASLALPAHQLPWRPVFQLPQLRGPLPEAMQPKARRRFRCAACIWRGLGRLQ